MQPSQIDLGHRVPNDPGEPLPYFTAEELARVRIELTCFELARLERNVRDHIAELAEL